MKQRLLQVLCGVMMLTVSSVQAQKVYNESGGLVVMEMENTDSPLGKWVFRATNTAGYPSGAKGTGHLEYIGPWAVANHPLEYTFKVNTAGVYYLNFRAHKRLNEGDGGDQHNDCFIKMDGDFTSGNAEIPLSVLQGQAKFFGGAQDDWGRARTIDHNQAHLKVVAYTFKAGETYTFTVFDRSGQFNVDRIIFSHESVSIKPSLTELASYPESELDNVPTANAGADQIIDLPAAQITLLGSGTDGGSIDAYSWSQVSGPNTAVLSGDATSDLTASSLVKGSYIFSLTVTDNEGLTDTDEVSVQVRDPNDIVTHDIWSEDFEGATVGENYGTGDTPAGTVVQLSNSLTCEVQPAPSGFTNATGKVIVLSTGTSIWTALRPIPNPIDLSSYQLAAGDTYKFSYDLYIPSALSESVGALQFRWKGGSITDNGALDETQEKSAAGAYHFEYTGTIPDDSRGIIPENVRPFIRFDQNGTAATDHVYMDNLKFEITVGGAVPPSTDPIANAGTDQVIVLPTSQITLNGSGTDDGSITNYNWSQTSGPSTATLSGQTTSNLTASALVAGTYVFSLTVTDNEGLSGNDQVSVVVVDPAVGGNISILGDKIIWHKITLELEGPTSAEDATPNPFSDYRMDVTFTHSVSGTTYTVPGYFAADGDAANSSANSGNKWHCHFRPDQSGIWAYSISLRTGSNVAMGTATDGTALIPFDGLSGTFDVSAVNPTTAPDLRSKGRLRYVGKHHLQFEGNGQYFLKFGPDSPENFLEYYEFDNTPVAGNKGARHEFTTHAQHYNSDGPLWQGTKGKNILGAVNYISSTGANSISMLLNNIGRTVPDPSRPGKTLSAPGDGARAFPFISTNVVDRVRYDCSKLDQWEMVFDHTEMKGLYLHFKLAEIEMARDLDIGTGDSLGNERKLYYREMVARFGHHLALNWNISEEIPVGSSTRIEWLKYLEEIDPWQNNRVFHTGPSLDKSNFFNPHLGDSELTGISLQTPEAIDTENVFNETKKWVDASAANGQPWIVACDEQGPGNLGVNQSFELSRKNVVWGNIMAGGGGSEFYSGGSDLSLDDYAHFEELLVWSDYAVNDFFYGENIPFWNMSNKDTLLSGGTAHCLTDEAGSYVVYLKNGGTTSLNLSGETGTFEVRWFDPRNGGGLQSGSVASVVGGSAVALGNAPSASTNDWAILVREPGSTPDPRADAGADQVIELPASQVTLPGSGTDNGSIVSYSWAQVSGPNMAALFGQTTTNLTASGLVLGTYVFRLTVTDDEGLTDSDDVSVEVLDLNAPRTLLTTIWGEDFESVAVGESSGNNETLAGTDIQTANKLSGIVVVAPAAFTMASGNVFCLSTSSNAFAAIRPDINPIDLTSFDIRDGDKFILSFDMYIPATLSVAVGGAQFRWKDAANTGNGATDLSGALTTAGEYHVEYMGTFPVDTGGGDFIPENVRPFIFCHQNGAVASSHMYIDNLSFKIGTAPEIVMPLYMDWSFSVGLTAAQVNPTLDIDGDGLTNLEEFLTGHDPINAASVFEVEAMTSLDTGTQSIVIEWDAKPNREYSVISVEDLATGEPEVIAEGLGYPVNSYTVDVEQATSGFLKVNSDLR